MSHPIPGHEYGENEISYEAEGYEAQIVNESLVTSMWEDPESTPTDEEEIDQEQYEFEKSLEKDKRDRY